MSNTASVTNVTNFPATTPSEQPVFIDRRQSGQNDRGIERRQFGNSYRDLSSAGRELAEAIDAYKVLHRRRYITPDEMLQVITELGYKK